MAKKVRFPLEMDGGIKVRDIESLRENFSLQRVMGYFENGKLVTWLRDRYANDMADQIESLNEDDLELARKICEALGVSYDGSYQEDIEEIAERNRKLALLKQYTTESEYLDNIDSVAFGQDDVYDLLDEGVDIIYLCGNKFSVPLGKKGIRYIGINRPVVVIDSKTEVNWKEKQIVLVNIEFDEKYQQIISKKKLDVEKEKQEGYCNMYTSEFLTGDMKKGAENCYCSVSNNLRKVEINSPEEMRLFNYLMSIDFDAIGKHYK